LPPPPQTWRAGTKPRRATPASRCCSTRGPAAAPPPTTISVSDTGRGLTSDDLPRAFERFYLYSRYGTDRPVGTGLGLAIVKDLTEAMGGSVAVASAVGVGTAVTVTLDVAAVPAQAPTTALEGAPTQQGGE